MLLILPTTQAQTWHSLNGPMESDVRDIVIKNDTLYVAAWDPGGLFKKKVGSNQWYYSEIAEGEGPFKSGISGLLSFNTNETGTYYAGGEGIVSLVDGQAYQHFFKSNDYGHTWKEMREGIEYGHTVRDIFITSGDDVLMGGRGGIFKLKKDENRFERTGGDGWAYAFYNHNDTLFVGTRAGIEYSVDDGATWNEAGTDTLEVYGISFAGDEFYFGTNKGLYKTKALDQPWTVVEDLTSATINALLTFQDKIIAGTDSGVFELSLDNSEVKAVFPDLSEQRINAINGVEEILYIGGEKGLYHCNLSQNSSILDGVPSSMIQTMSFHNNDTLIVSSSSQIYRYSTFSNQWDSLSISIKSARNIIPISQDSLLTISGRYFLRCSFEHGSCDNTLVDPDNTLFSLTQSKVGDLFLVSKAHVFQSKDKGNTWNSIFNFETNKRYFRSPIFTVSDSLLFFDAAEQGLVKYSLNTGNYSIVGFEETGINSYYLTKDGVIYVSAFNSIHKSTDFGKNWKTLLQSKDVHKSDILIEILHDEVTGKKYVISSEGRIYVSDDEEGNWGINEEMSSIYLESAVFGPNGKIYLGTSGAGVFTNTKPIDPPITISNEEEQSAYVPKRLELSAYPNPFNPSTQLQYTLPEAGNITISIFNVLGQQVRTLAEGTRSSGNHTITFNATGLPAGMYVVRLESTGQSGKVFTETKKVMLLK